ncbi:AAA-like domain-containing protein [Nostoc punctiforme FACHB-252]|uniref:AAA-like domain-containing protein n=1 Tax=Nostoc punctiforme FACHB-252 TaxID=1357509 RepID=A0ABR8H7A8_NOSPU|nr:AAA-like domain-containing protein [Nostoc punctiforme]MBD2611273.1 AAA-like domain-containing protein [Nostoc punctiforme FACHB-252]
MRYQVGGSLYINDPTYIVRQADEKLYSNLKTGNLCYIFTSRQMGKSSLLHRTSHRLQKEGYECVYLDFTQLVSDDITPAQWYKSIIISLLYSLNLAEEFNFQQWWKMQANLSPVEKLYQFIEELLLLNIQKTCQTKGIFIFIDEIDSLLNLNFPVNDFFAWIRYCYEQQAYNPNFKRLGFALFGVASPSGLITDSQQTPFNIATAIELFDFQLDETQPLLPGLKTVISQPEIVLQEILYWSRGQPFLTQKLCHLVMQTTFTTSTGKINLSPKSAASWVEELVRSHIIQDWESQDQPQHLRTIRDRLLFFNQQQSGRLLSLYHQILQAQEAQQLRPNSSESFPSSTSLSTPYSTHIDNSPEQTELLLSGLVQKHNGYLKIKNPIYRTIFNSQWVLTQLNNTAPL